MNIIKCPSCQTEIPLDAALSAQVEKDLDAKYNKRLADEKKSLEKKLREEISSKQSDEIQELEDALKYERQLAETAGRLQRDCQQPDYADCRYGR